MTDIQQRVIEESLYMIKTENTIRQIAKVFGVSKSTVHKDLQERLYNIDKQNYKKVQKILQKHIEIRHINGGAATKKKYLKLKE